MSVRWEVKKGNTSVQNILVKDKNDNIVTTLNIATEIKFVIKKTKTAVAALVEKTAVALGGIVIDDPTTGYLKITLTPTDTGVTLSVGDYFMAIQITWSPTEVWEVNMEIDDVKTDRFRIKQDIV